MIDRVVRDQTLRRIDVVLRSFGVEMGNPANFEILRPADQSDNDKAYISAYILWG